MSHPDPTKDYYGDNEIMSARYLVDGYEVLDKEIQAVIEKLCEADGSPIFFSKLDYMAEAAKLLVRATTNIALEENPEVQ